MPLLAPARLAPHFDREARTLSWGVHVVKHFRQVANNQVLVLTAAEELGWPDWFDDPLPRDRAHNPKTRLHDTIKDLNRRQNVSLLHFMGDGTGTRIGWKLRLE